MPLTPFSDPPASLPRQLVLGLWQAVRRFDLHGGWVMSSHVAMSLMLSIFPFLLFVAALAGALSRDVDTDQLIGMVFGLWPEAIADPIATEIRKVLNGSSTGLMTVGGVLALYFASNGVDAIRVALSRAYRDDDPRPFWINRALSLGFVLVGGALVLVALTFGYALPAYFHYIAGAMPERLASWIENRALTRSVTVLALTAGIAACHVWLPGMRHRLADVWPGLVLTLGLWYAAARGFAVYMAQFADYGATYAGLAGAMAGLIFLYLIAAILIFGAELNGALIRKQGAD